MGFKAALGLTAAANVFLIVALIFSLLAAIFLQPAAGLAGLIGVAYFGIALIFWLVGVVLLLGGFLASRGVRSRTIGALFALASVYHLVFLGLVLSSALTSTQLVVGPILFAVLLAIAAIRRM